MKDYKILLSYVSKKTKIFIVFMVFMSTILAILEALNFLLFSKLLTLNDSYLLPSTICFNENICLMSENYLVLTGATIIGLFITGVLTVWITAELGARVSTDLATGYFRYIGRLPVNVLAQEGNEKTQNILLNESQRVGNSVVLPFLIFIVKTMQLIALLIIAAVSEGLLVLVAGCTPIVVYLLITFFVSQRLVSIGQLFTSTFESRLKLVSSTYLGIKEIKINSSFDIVSNSFSSEQKLLERNQVHYTVISNFPRYVLELILMSALVLVVYAKTINFIDYDLSNLLILGFFALRLVPILQTIYSSLSAVRSNIISWKNYLASVRLFDVAHDKVTRIEKPFSDSKILGGLTLADGSDYLISDEGQYLVTGPSGIGKTSMVDFMIGLRFDCLQNIFYNSNNHGRRRFSYCSQNTFIDDQFLKRIDLDFKSSKMQNNEQILSLFSAFALSPIIESRKNSPNVHFQLSGGERQRLAIMACVVKDAKFFIFDEPTNNLDTASKQALKEFLASFNKGFMLITHDEEIMGVVDRHIEFSEDGIQLIARAFKN